MPLDYRTGGDVGPALGAARLAMIGADRGDVETAIRRVCAQPAPEVHYARLPGRRDYHQTKLARYRRLYALTRELQGDPP
jgi:xylulokinase